MCFSNKDDEFCNDRQSQTFSVEEILYPLKRRRHRRNLSSPPPFLTFR